MYIDRNMKNEKFEVSSISTEKCSKLRPVLRFPVTQKAALVWNTTVFVNALVSWDVNLQGLCVGFCRFL